MAAKLWQIHVRTIDGGKTTSQEEDVRFYHRPVAELVKAACNKIGLPNHEEFTFTLYKQAAVYGNFKRKVPLLRASKTKLYTNDELGLLNPKKSFKQQGINETAALTLNLRKRLFFTETVYCSCHNEKALDLTYLQLQNAVITGNSICSCTFEKAVELAALQCRIEYENCNIDEDFLDNKLKSLLPRKYTKVQGITSTILRAYSSLELSESSSAKSEYIRLCTTLDRYGITYFSGEERMKKPPLIKCCLGITHDFIWRIEAKSCEVLEKWHIASVQRWNLSPNNFLVTLSLQNDRSYSFLPSGECDTILQLLDDYKAITNRSVEVPMELQSGRNWNSPDSSTTSLGESASSEDPPISSEGDNIRSELLEVSTLSAVSIARRESAVSPANDGETNSLVTDAVKDTRVSSEGQGYERDTPISSEEDSPVHIQDHLTITKLKSVWNKIWEARSKWLNIGIELNLAKNDLDAISATNGSDTDACFREMLSLWLKQTKSLPSWSKMIRALKRPAVGFQRLAEDIEKKLTKQYLELLHFSHDIIDITEPDEENREELEGRLREQTKDIIREFNILKHKLFDTLEDQKYSILKLKRYLEDYGADNLETMNDVRDFIQKNSSFFDYDILKYLIELAGEERDKSCLKKYDKCFEAYARSRVYKCSSNTGASPGNPDSQSSKLCIELDSEYDKYKDDDKLKQFQYRLCNILNIPL